MPALMDQTTDCPFAETLSARMRASRSELTRRWLERIQARVSLEPERIFPSDELLDHMPVLIDGIAAYVQTPVEEITADMPVIAKAMELGELRLHQGFDAHEIMKEYELLGGVLFHFAETIARESPDTCTTDQLLACGHRLFRAIAVIEQVTTSHYLRVLGERVAEREERLRRFNRMITHELKNRVGAVIGAGQLLQEEWVGPAERARFATMVVDNAQSIQKVMENLTALSRLDGDRRRQKNIRLPEAVNEVYRQLRDLARHRGVQLRRGAGMPDVEVNAAAVELCLSNYVSNAIKYSNPDPADRWVVVEATLDEASAQADADGVTCALVVRVRDNGMGVPPEKRDRLFERFFRAHEGADVVEGTGLGLSLVRETVESIGGRAWAEFDTDEGAVFAFAMPCRRAGEAQEAEEQSGADAAPGEREGSTPAPPDGSARRASRSSAQAG